ncbi:MAG: hypothetical protein ACI92S_001801 [Planctomycetaceae bacterium]
MQQHQSCPDARNVGPQAGLHLRTRFSESLVFPRIPATRELLLEDGDSASCADPVGGPLPFFLAATGDHNARAESSKQPSRCETNSSTTASHDRHFSREIHPASFYSSVSHKPSADQQPVAIIKQAYTVEAVAARR